MGLWYGFRWSHDGCGLEIAVLNMSEQLDPEAEAERIMSKMPFLMPFSWFKTKRAIAAALRDAYGRGLADGKDE